MAKNDAHRTSNFPHIVTAKTTEQIALEWDQVADQRAYDIESGLDISYVSVLTPTVLGMLPRDTKSSNVLDVGCGTGALGRTIAPLVHSLVGVDPSIRSIQIAKAQASDRGATNTVWLATDIETYAKTVQTERARFDVAVANMTLMDTADLTATLVAIASLCRKGSKLVWTITHPWFWPRYWGYSEEAWFDYKREIWIEAEFKTTRTMSGVNTTHIHRPLEMYLNAFVSAGFGLTELHEPIPHQGVNSRMSWRYPRFLAGSCVLI